MACSRCVWRRHWLILDEAISCWLPKDKDQRNTFERRSYNGICVGSHVILNNSCHFPALVARLCLLCSTSECSVLEFRRFLGGDESRLTGEVSMIRDDLSGFLLLLSYGTTGSWDLHAVKANLCPRLVTVATRSNSQWDRQCRWCCVSVTSWSVLHLLWKSSSSSYDHRMHGLASPSTYVQMIHLVRLEDWGIALLCAELHGVGRAWLRDREVVKNHISLPPRCFKGVIISLKLRRSTTDNEHIEETRKSVTGFGDKALVSFVSCWALDVICTRLHSNVLLHHDA
jgi:hypothetical protein